MDSRYEADYIEKEVQLRKQRAKDLGILTMFEKLYQKIPHYPAWIKNEHNREYVCSLVTDAVKLEDDVVKIKLKDKEYTFKFIKNSFSTPDGEFHQHGKRELYSDARKLLSVNMAYECDEFSFGGCWSAFDTAAFVDGEWIKDFKELFERIEIEDKDRERKRRENPDRLNKLKEDFGIE